MASRPRRDAKPADPHAKYREEAQKKLDARRGLAEKIPASPETNQPGTNIARLAERLTPLGCQEILPDGGANTLAMGLLDGKRLLVCNKGVKKVTAELVANKVLAKLKELVQDTQTKIEKVPKPRDGLHAEMAIIAHVLKGVPEASKENLATFKDRLQIICLGKGVCPDCAGFMNKHQIPHFSLQPDGGDDVRITTDLGPPSSGGQWIHPRTRAIFHTDTPEGKAIINSWRKGDKST